MICRYLIPICCLVLKTRIQNKALTNSFLFGIEVGYYSLKTFYIMARFDTELERIFQRAERENLPQPDLILLNRDRWNELIAQLMVLNGPLANHTFEGTIHLISYRQTDFVFDPRANKKLPFQSFVKA